jgi:signal transduction histidine kinase/ActR/RegA family two-component response regulator
MCAVEAMAPAVRHFVELLPEPSFLVRATSGRVAFVNAAAARMLKIDRVRLQDGAFPDLLAAPREKFSEYLRLWARSRQLLPGALRFQPADGEVLDIRCDGALLEPRSDGVEGLVFVRCRPQAEATDHFVLLNQKLEALSKEIIERRKAEQQRDELLNKERLARVAAERASRMKDEFLATLSHELRTPLNAILGWTTLLQTEPLPQSVSEGIEVIARNAHVQRQLIEDLLDMSRIIAGRVRLDVQTVALASVIEAAVAAVRPGAEAKGVRIQVALDPIAGPVKGDPNRLQQIVWNLLSNALKFTPRGGRVQVFLERVNSHLEITVADTGEGIRPEFLPFVFDRFQQADPSTTRRHSGLGIGLSIAKQLVELHGGSIRAKSPGEGKGATFTVALPLPTLQEHGPSGEAPADGYDQRVHPASGTVSRLSPGECPMDLAGVNALVVDDELDGRDVVQKLLQKCNARVFTAASADEAIEQLRHHGVDVLISDIGMPGRDGYDLIRQIRQLDDQPRSRVPAIALTAFARSEDRTKAMMAGYNLHLSKPVELNELVVAVGSLAGRTGPRGARG